MRQLSLWTDPPTLSPPTAVVVEERPSHAAHHQTNRAADKCRQSADALQRYIDAKHHSANNMFVLPPTRKRLNVAMQARKEALRLEGLQESLRQLAEMHESGNIQSELAGIRTKNALETALLTLPNTSAVHQLYKAAKRDERREERVMRLTAEAAGMGIPGYFPTPAQLASHLVLLSNIEPGNRILEPSAGTGNLIDAILRSHQDVSVSYCEFNCFLLEVLREKYEQAKNVTFVARDVCELDANRIERFDRILMNPPFENAEDATHVLHAWCALLAPGGILTAIVSAGLFSRRERKAEQFRNLLRDERARVHDVPAGSFKSSRTGVEAKIVQLRAGGW